MKIIIALFTLTTEVRLTGSKNACGQGNCGACSVLLSEFDHKSQTIRHVTVNSCITPLFYVHGCAVTTVEGIGTSRDGLHPVQKSLVQMHGIQCGFCTPGMVVSLCCLLRNNPTPTKADVERAIEGNLCRCTGYRPILESMSPFAGCPMGAKCCKNKSNKLDTNDTEPEARPIDPTQDSIFPPQLMKWHLKDTLSISYGHTTWIVPCKLEQLRTVWTEHPTAQFVAGATAVGATTNHDGGPIIFISCHRVEELQAISVNDKKLEFGAAVTFTKMEDHIRKLEIEGAKPVVSAFLACIRSLASDQLRNVATIGGHLACRMDGLDMIPLLFALNATVHLMDHTGKRRDLTVEEYLSNEQTGKELILNIQVPLDNKVKFVGFYKTPRKRPVGSAGTTTALVLDTGGHFIAYLEGLSPKIIKLDVFSYLPETERTIQSLSLDKFDRILRKRLSEEKAETRDDLVNLSAGILQKFQAVVNEQTTPEAESPHSELPIHCRSDIIFDEVLDSQPQTDPVWRPLPQTTAEDLVSGQAMFIDDMPSYQNELHLCLVLGKRARAKLVHVDWSAVKACPGVVDWIDHTSLNGRNMWGIMAADEEIFASKEVVYWGQPIGAVVAESREQATHAAEKVRIDYEEMQPVLTIEDAVKLESFIEGAVVIERGDGTEGFLRSNQVVEGTIGTGAQEHLYLETNGAIGVPKREQHEIEMFVTHQAPTFIQKSIASCLGIPFNRVIVRHKRTGGAFGGKESQPVKICVPVALAAQRTGRPVRGILTREQDMAITGKRHPYQFQYKIGFSKDGVLQALEVKVYSNAGCSRDVSLEVLDCTLNFIEGCYAIPNVKIEGRLCKTNTVSNTSFRGFGIPQAYVAMETIIDHVAHVLKIGSKQIQEINFAKSGFVPFTKLPIQDETIVEAWNQCQRQANYLQKEADVIAFNEKHSYKKRGIAMMAIRFQMGYPVSLLNQSTALVHVYLDGSVSLSHGGCEIGQGLNMKIQQIASRALSVPLSKIHIAENSTNTVANATATVGSCTTDLVGAAVLNACGEITNRLQPFKEKKPNASWEELIIDAYLNRISLSVMAQGRPGDGGVYYYTYGVGCSTVEIDCLTGEHKVLSTDIVMDVGRSLNPGIDVGQIEGAFMQGYGMMAVEEWTLNDRGEVESKNPSRYRVPDVGNLPRDFNVTLLSDSPNKQAIVYSSKGIGEPPLLLATTVHKALRAAILSARKDRSLSAFVQLDTPVTPAKIRQACTIGCI